MPSFSRRSLARLETCDPDLQRLFLRVVKTWDCTILEGHRGRVAQDAAVRAGLSRVQWPHGNHNKEPSAAADVAPWPLDWTNLDRFYMFAGYVLGVASEMGIPIRSGLDWDSDRETTDQSLIDGPHFELVSSPSP